MGRKPHRFGRFKRRRFGGSKMGAVDLTRHFIMPNRIYTKLRFVESDIEIITAPAISFNRTYCINQPGNVRDVAVPGSGVSQGYAFYDGIYRYERTVGCKITAECSHTTGGLDVSATMYMGIDNVSLPSWTTTGGIRNAQSRNLSQRVFKDYQTQDVNRRLLKISMWAPISRALSKTKKQILTDNDFQLRFGDTQLDVDDRAYVHFGVLMNNETTLSAPVAWGWKVYLTYYTLWYDRNDVFV